MTKWLVYCDFVAGQDAFVSITGLVGIFDTEKKAKNAVESTWNFMTAIYSRNHLTDQGKEELRKYIHCKAVEENHVYSCHVSDDHYDDCPVFYYDLEPDFCISQHFD